MPDSEENPSAKSGAETLCIYQLLFHEPGILRKILSVMDNRNFRMVHDGAV